MEEKEFLDWLSQFTDSEAAFHSLKNAKEAFRVNTLKTPVSVFDEVSRIGCSGVPWLDSARVPNGGDGSGNGDAPVQPGKTFEYFLGYLHPQSLSSMVPPLVLEPKKGERVLDITASPGSKTTQISAMMENTGVLVANDLPEREIFIVNNIARLGALNVLVTNRDAKAWPIKNNFDRVLLDAPCTALGSNLNALRRFSEGEAGRMASVQKRMILPAFDALKPGGTLVYSTCTYPKEENEAVVSHLLGMRRDALAEAIGLPIPHEEGLDGLGEAWRIYPQTLGSEGFFMAKIRKRGD